MKLIADGISVRYESAEQNEIYFYGSNGTVWSGFKQNFLPQIKGYYVSIYDCHRNSGNNILVDPEYPTVVFSTSNIYNYNQYKYICSSRFYIPSTTKKEFLNYANILKIPKDHVKDVISKCGYSKISPLTMSHNKWELYQNDIHYILEYGLFDDIIRALQPNFGSSTDATYLIQGYLNTENIKKLQFLQNNENEIDVRKIKDIYRAPNIECSFITSNIIEIVKQRANLVHKKILAVKGYYTEENVPSCIVDYGLTYYSSIKYIEGVYTVKWMSLTEVNPEYNCNIEVIPDDIDRSMGGSSSRGSWSKSSSDSKTSSSSGRGNSSTGSDSSSSNSIIARILKYCQDPTVYYHFGNYIPMFNSFIPPNTFIKTITTTYTKKGNMRKGNDGILLSGMLEVAAILKDQEIEYITVISKDLEECNAYKCTQPFKIDVPAVYEQMKRSRNKSISTITTTTSTTTSGTTITTSTTPPNRVFNSLPNEVKETLKGFKQHYGFFQLPPSHSGLPSIATLHRNTRRMNNTAPYSTLSTITTTSSITARTSKQLTRHLLKCLR